jgi:hypothetical protein
MADRVVTQVWHRPSLPQLQKTLHEKRVAAYARVSTDSDEQMGSVEAQKDYFEKLILEHPGWVLVGIYADEGISGTSLAHREAFNRMVDDAVDGKIDLIITKSLSRFARNTIDALNVIRKLKGAGVGVYFEKENIDTANMTDEIMITILGGLAQEESTSISANMKWSYQKQIEEGTYGFEDEVEVFSMPRCWRFEKLGKATLTHSIDRGFVLTGHYNGEEYRIERTPIQTNSLHIEYDWCYLKPEDCIDVSCENDSFFCYPNDKRDIVTKMAFATEIIYENEMQKLRAEREERKAKKAATTDTAAV